MDKHRLAPRRLWTSHSHKGPAKKRKQGTQNAFKGRRLEYGTRSDPQHIHLY